MANQTITGTLYDAFTGEPVIPVTDKSINRVTLNIWAPAEYEGDCFNKLYIDPETVTTMISHPFYSASFDMSYPGIPTPYCYPCMYSIYVYYDYKLDSGDWIRFASPVKNILIEENCNITQDFDIPIAFPYEPTPTATPTATATPTPPAPGPQIEEYLKCLLPRILTGNLSPRITTSDPIPRITCLNRVGKSETASKIPPSAYIDYSIPEPGSTKIYYQTSQK